MGKHHELMRQLRVLGLPVTQNTFLYFQVRGENKLQVVITTVTLCFIFLQDIYILVAQPARYKPWRPVFHVAFGLLFMIFSIFFYWNAYRPRVGPVGNGPNDAVIWSNFLYTMIVGGCFLTLGMVGWAVVRSFKSKNHHESLDE